MNEFSCIWIPSIHVECISLDSSFLEYLNHTPDVVQMACHKKKKKDICHCRWISELYSVPFSGFSPRGGGGFRGGRDSGGGGGRGGFGRSPGGRGGGRGGFGGRGRGGGGRGGGGRGRGRGGDGK